eukprot:2637231-Rhodomonas_salina.2
MQWSGSKHEGLTYRVKARWSKHAGQSMWVKACGSKHEGQSTRVKACGSKHAGQRGIDREGSHQHSRGSHQPLGACARSECGW